MDFSAISLTPPNKKALLETLRDVSPITPVEGAFFKNVADDEDPKRRKLNESTTDEDGPSILSTSVESERQLDSDQVEPELSGTESDSSGYDSDSSCSCELRMKDGEWVITSKVKTGVVTRSKKSGYTKIPARKVRLVVSATSCLSIGPV